MTIHFLQFPPHTRSAQLHVVRRNSQQKEQWSWKNQEEETPTPVFSFSVLQEVSAVPYG